MKEEFISKDFGDTSLRMITTINAILDDYNVQGYDLSLRQLYYQLVSRNIVANTEKSYKNVGSLVSGARLAGMIDWDMIKDRGREVISNPHWRDPVHFIESAAPQYRFDLWADQTSYVEVMVEKQALEGVLEPICRSYDVPFTANKGYSSSSAMYEASKRFLIRADQKKQLYVIYLGDHDPSGIDMSRDVLERLRLFIDTMNVDESLIEVHRVALNMDQIDALKPPENPAKITDSRAASYIQRFGTSSWELDAIEPKQLAGIVSSAIERVVDMNLFNKNRRKQHEERQNLLKFARTYLKKGTTHVKRHSKTSNKAR